MTRTAFVVLVGVLLPCSAPLALAAPSYAGECRKFDFVVGNWLVKDRAGKAIATQSASRLGECTLVEKWRGVGGTGEGLAVTTYQSAEKRWHRDALIRSPVVLGFEGRISGSSMVMTAKQYSEFGVDQIHRISWTPRGDGSVEETWQTSTNTGVPWKTRFDEFLTRIAE